MHPFATAFAFAHLKTINQILEEKREIAHYIKNEIKNISGLTFPPVPSNSEPSWYTFPLIYNKRKFDNLPKEVFVKALHAEGAEDVDIPRSTCPINNYPLFKNPERIFPKYQKFKNRLSINNKIFRNASLFHKQIINFPVWYGKNRMAYAKNYIKAIKKVVENYKLLLKLK